MQRTSRYNVGEYVRTLGRKKSGATAPDLDQCLKSSKIDQNFLQTTVFGGVLMRLARS